MSISTSLRLALFQDAVSGGARRAAQEMAEALRRQGAQVDACCPSQARHAEFSQVPVRTQPTLRDVLWDCATSFWNQRQLARKIDDQQYGAAFIHPGYLGAPPILRFLKRTPSIYFCQEPLRIAYEEEPLEISLPPGETSRYSRADRNEKRQRWIQNRIRPWMKRIDSTNLHAASLVLCNSKRSQEAIQKAYGCHAQICYLGVDSGKFLPDPAVVKESAVLTVGIGGLRKGHDLLLRALAQLPIQQRPQLWVVDRTLPEHQQIYLETVAQFLEVKLKIFSHLTDSHLIDLYRRASVFAFAPIREPFGLVVLEAMSCELPVVVVDEAGASEAIQHNTTGLITPRTAHALSQAIQHLLSHPKEAKAMATKARQEILRSWTWDHAAERLLRIWEEHRP